jgi:pyrophosphatase PpaX
VECVLFDLDGTLADTVPLILASYRHTMEVHRGEALPDELWLQHLGRPLRDTLQEFGRDEAEAHAMMETYVGFQREAHDRMVAPYEGAREVVETLEARGVRLAVVTSKRREMARRTLAHCGLDGPMETMVTADDVEKGKPDPEPVRTALGRMGIEAGPGVVFVGDSPFDMTAGRAAGVGTAAALWGPFSRSALEASEPDRWLGEVREVLTLAGR